MLTENEKMAIFQLRGHKSKKYRHFLFFRNQNGVRVDLKIAFQISPSYSLVTKYIGAMKKKKIKD